VADSVAKHCFIIRKSMLGLANNYGYLTKGDEFHLLNVRISKEDHEEFAGNLKTFDSRKAALEYVEDYKKARPDVNLSDFAIVPRSEFPDFKPMNWSPSRDGKNPSR